MEFIIIIELIIFVFLMALSGFFSGSETALFSINRIQLEQMERENHPKIKLIQRLLSEPRRLIVTILIGNEFVNVAASVLSASLVMLFLGGEGKWWVNIFIMLPILLLVGEITPKTVAIKNNVAFASFVGHPLNLFARLITPLRIVIRFVADYFTTLLVGKERSKGNIVTEDMVRTLAQHATSEGILDPNESQYINNIFDFGNQTVREIMTPRSNVRCFSIETPIPTIMGSLKTEPRTRIPIYRGRLDTVIGILHVRDLLNPKVLMGSLDSEKFIPLLRKPVFVPDSKPIADLFHLFRERRISFAMALDEYGGVTGLVTMDDILEAIFGAFRPMPTISSEYITKKNGVRLRKVNGDIPVARFNEEMGAELALDVAETMSGLLLHHLGELPTAGKQITMGDWNFTVIKVDENRIVEIECNRSEEEPEFVPEQDSDSNTQLESETNEQSLASQPEITTEITTDTPPSS